MSRCLPLILGLLLPTLARADERWSVRFEPLYGVEHTTNRYPEPPRSTTRTFYGLRVIAGAPLLALELEGTQAQDTRRYESENQKIEDQVTRLLFGVRSTVPATSWFDVFARGGARGTLQKTTITDTATGTKDVKDPPLGWDPYAGAGLQITLAQLFAVSAGATWFFVDDAPADVQYSLGFTLKFGETR